MPWLFHNSLTDTSDGREILLPAPGASPDGTRTVGLVNGSVRKIPEAEFQTLWSRK